MSPERFREILDGWTTAGLAQALDVDEREVRRWKGGSAAIPAAVAEWLERLARHREENPPPPPPSKR